MNIATGNVISVAPAAPMDWVVAFNLDGDDEIVCLVVGWATVVTAHLKDGTAATAIEPAFFWADTVWTSSELREHTPGLSGIEIRPNTGLFGEES
ncbi:hypothetical protein OG215_25145 [Streptomyces globisporus]|uniref:hypothetical protein n=1 Tax=Streptomyces globisporus TaxID=1908 RepID=UPI0038659AE1|nr:hypothetical protein OG215_25145 [Streptomyces globisporus]